MDNDEIGMELRQAASLQEAPVLLGDVPCRVAVVDSGLLETEFKVVDRLLYEIPSAVPIFPNLAVCGQERLVCEIRAALRPGERESQRALDHARRELRSNLKDSITAFLLTCDLALQIPDLPSQAGQKVILLHDLATKMRDLLEIEISQGASA